MSRVLRLPEGFDHPTVLPRAGVCLWFELPEGDPPQQLGRLKVTRGADSFVVTSVRVGGDEMGRGGCEMLANPKAAIPASLFAEDRLVSPPGFDAVVRPGVRVALTAQNVSNRPATFCAEFRP